MFKKKNFLIFMIIFLTVSLVSFPVSASVGLYVGSDLTDDGSVLLGGYGDEPSSHWIEVMPSETHPSDATMEVGITEEAGIPGERFEIPQAKETNKYIAVKYSSWAGFPPPLENGGLNEHNVAGRDIWAPSREELVEMTPEPQQGLSYSDHARVAMERATSAEEAAEIVGEMVDEHGHATYGGNSHMFADEDEGWGVIQFAGGEGLWVAERFASDEIRVYRPGYIGEIPENFQEHPDYMGSDNLISFAEEQGWYDPEEEDTFNVKEVYGADRQPDEPGFQKRSVSVETMEDYLLGQVPVTLEDMKDAVRSPMITRQTAGYGTVAQLQDDIPREMKTLWATVAPSLTSPFLPHYIGMENVPVEFQWGRYMSVGESAAFFPEDLQPKEATEYAYRTFKRLYYAVNAPGERMGTADYLGPEWDGEGDEEFFSERFNEFYPEVYDTLTAFEEEMREDQDFVMDTAEVLLENEKHELAQNHLTEYSNNQALEALDIVETLTESIVMRGELLFDIEEFSSDEIYEEYR